VKDSPENEPTKLPEVVHGISFPAVPLFVYATSTKSPPDMAEESVKLMFDPRLIEETDLDAPFTVTTKSPVCGFGVGFANAFTGQPVIAMLS
jgi:hypothetical protein